MSVNVAVVGAGYWGPNLIRNFASLPGSRLAAICDLNPARLDPITQQYGVHATTHLEEILSDPAIGAVAIATPAESHHAVAEACLRARKHVYVEKPVAANSRDARALVRLTEETGSILMVGHLFLCDPAVTRLISLVQERAVGQVR